MSDKFGIHFFELKKLDNVTGSQEMEDWLHLINAETEGEIMELQQTTTIPEVQKTIVILRHLNADERVRQEAYYREKQLRDEANAIDGSRREGFQEGKAEGLAEGEAKGLANGKDEMKQTLIEKWRARGMTDEEILDLLEE